MLVTEQDTLEARRQLSVDAKRYDYFSLEAAAAAGFGDLARLPFALMVLGPKFKRRR